MSCDLRPQHSTVNQLQCSGVVDVCCFSPRGDLRVPRRQNDPDRKPLGLMSCKRYGNLVHKFSVDSAGRYYRLPGCDPIVSSSKYCLFSVVLHCLAFCTSDLGLVKLFFTNSSSYNTS